MSFKLMDRAAYRALSNEAFELRSQEVRDELANAESEFTTEQMRTEVGLVNDEKERRAMIDEFKVETRKAVEGGKGKVVATSEPEPKQVRTKLVDRAEDALSSPEYMRAFAHYLTHRGAKLEPEFEQYQKRDGGSSGALASPTAGVLSDAGILVPLTIQQTIIQKMEDRGQVWNNVTKTNIPGGVDIPTGDFKMTASWIGEKQVSDTQVIDPVGDPVSFRYHQLECRHANTLLAEQVSPQVYMRNYAEKAADAMIDALESVILNGDGSAKPLGLLVDPRIGNVQSITAADFTLEGFEDKVKNTIARLASGYRGGRLYMSETTWNYYFEGMTDDNGQPIARVNYGMEGEVTRIMFGQRVEALPEKYLPYFTDAVADEKPFMFYGNLADYTVNTNMEMRADRWEDKDNNLYKSRLLMIVDGRVIDPYGFVKFTAGASA